MSFDSVQERFFRPLLCLVVIAGALAASPSPSAASHNDGYRWNKSRPRVRLVAGFGTPVLDGTLSPDEWTASAYTVGRKVRAGAGTPAEPGSSMEVRAMNDDSNLYLSISHPRNAEIVDLSTEFKIFDAYSAANDNSDLNNNGVWYRQNRHGQEDGFVAQSDGSDSVHLIHSDLVVTEFKIPLVDLAPGGVADPRVNFWYSESDNGASKIASLTYFRPRIVLANPELLPESMKLVLQPTEVPPTGVSSEPLAIDIDGQTDLSEWNGAHIETLVFDDAVEATMLVKNSSDTLYVRTEVPVGAGGTITSSDVWVDGDNNGSQGWIAPDYRFVSWMYAGGARLTWPKAEWYDDGRAVASTIDTESGLLITEMSGPMPPTWADGSEPAKLWFSAERNGMRETTKRGLIEVPLQSVTEELRVLSYNIGTYGKQQGDKYRRLEAVADEIVNGKIDIAAIQEIGRDDRRFDGVTILAGLLQERGYPMYWESTERFNPPGNGLSGADYGQAVFSRYPIEDYRVTYLYQPSDKADEDTLTPLPDPYLPVEEMKIRVSTSADPVTVINWHPRPGGYACWGNAQLRRLVSGEIGHDELRVYDKFGLPVSHKPDYSQTTLIMGDFNQHEKNPGGGCRSGIWTRQNDFVNACETHQGDHQKCDSVVARSGPYGPVQIDHIFHRSHDGLLTLVDSWRDDTPATPAGYPEGISDHWPIYATYHLN